MANEDIYTDQRLLMLVGEGNKNAYREIFNRHWPQVYGVSLRLTKSPELSKDLAQEIFIKLWTNRSKFPEVNNISAYIYAISRNYVIDYLRKNVLALSNSQALEEYFIYDDPGPQLRLEYLEMEDLVKEAIVRLSPKVQEVFILSRYEGLSHEQIARRMGISRVTSKAYVVRALSDIRKYIANHNDTLTFLAGWLLFKMICPFFF